MVLTYCKNNQIESNIFQDNEQKGLVLKNSSDNDIIYNRFIKTEFNLLYNKYTAAMFFYINGNHWEGNYWFKPRVLPKIIIGKIGEDKLRFAFEFDRKPARSI